MLDSNKTGGNITLDGIEGGENNAAVKFNNNNTFSEKNYLNTKLAKGETERDIRIRLLPIDKNSNTPFLRVHTHYAKVPVEVSANGGKAYICLRENNLPNSDALGKKCPFCEEKSAYYQKYLEAKKDGDDVLAKEMATKSFSYKTNEECIVRCIERGKEEDGPKFWKFGIRKDLKDPKNQILQILEDIKKEAEEEHDEVENIFDLDTGYDFRLSIKAQVDSKTGQPNGKVSTSVSMVKKSTPLSEDSIIRDKWVNDEKLWSDVFVAKPYDYLAIVKDYKIPYYDKAENKWITKEEYEAKKNGVVAKKEAEVEESKQVQAEAEKKILTEAKAAEEESDDLPF